MTKIQKPNDRVDRAAMTPLMDRYELPYRRYGQTTCYAERLAIRRRAKRSATTATDYRLRTIKAMGIFNSTRIGVYKEGIISRGRPIPENDRTVGLLARVARNRCCCQFMSSIARASG